MSSKARTLDAFVIHQLSNMIHCHHLAAREQERDAPSSGLGCLGFLAWRHQPAPRQCRNNPPGCTPFPFRQFLGRLKHVIFDIKGRPHKVMLSHQCIKVKPIKVEPRYFKKRPCLDAAIGWNIDIQQ
jgi:hypothetical protein